MRSNRWSFVQIGRGEVGSIVEEATPKIAKCPTASWETAFAFYSYMDLDTIWAGSTNSSPFIWEFIDLTWGLLTEKKLLKVGPRSKSVLRPQCFSIVIPCDVKISITTMKEHTCTNLFWSTMHVCSSVVTKICWKWHVSMFGVACMQGSGWFRNRIIG